MNRQQWMIVGLVAVVASLATLLAADLLGARRAYAQEGSQTGYIAVVAAPVVRSRLIPLVIVDMQAMSIMTYDYEIGGNYRNLNLTCVRSFKYDRKLVDYSHRNHARPHQSAKPGSRANSVKDIMKAIGKQEIFE